MVFFVVFLFLFIPDFSYSKYVAEFSKGKAVYKIALEDVREAYQAIISSTLNAPPPSQFVKDYVRYRIAVREAYADKSLVRSPQVRKMMVDGSLKKALDQALYKAYAEKKMQSKILKAQRNIRSFSEVQLKKHYDQSPNFNFSFIVIEIPSSASQGQIKAVEKRAKQIHSKVVKSKKSFADLIKIYSDNALIGNSGVSYSRNTLYPLLYQTLERLKPQQISRPVRAPGAFYILKLNQKLPFSQANKEDIRRQMLSDQRTKILDTHFNSLQAKYRVKIDKKMAASL